MGAKYEPLRRELESAPADEPVSFSFAELDALVGGLPPGARADRTWWGNTFNRSRAQALSWMSTGRRVTEVRLGKAVVFSPADAPTSAPTPSGSTSQKPGALRAAIPILDGARALAGALERAGYRTVLHAVAAHSIFLDPATVAQSEGKALFRIVRHMTRRGEFGELDDGTPVLFDDNRGPTLAFLWAAHRANRPTCSSITSGANRRTLTPTPRCGTCAPPRRSWRRRRTAPTTRTSSIFSATGRTSSTDTCPQGRRPLILRRTTGISNGLRALSRSTTSKLSFAVGSTPRPGPPPRFRLDGSTGRSAPSVSAAKLRALRPEYSSWQKRT